MPEITTTHFGGAAYNSNAPKPFTWSYSRLKNYETCPKRHFEVDIAKHFKEEESEQLTWGNIIHSAAANYISKGTLLPTVTERMLKPWCDRILTSGGNSVFLVEQKLAITKAFGPCGYFDKDVWYRGVADVIKIMDDVALAVDWKTGKILEDAVQLALMAACIFAHHSGIQKIRTEFVWLKENVSSRADFARGDMPSMWRNIWPRIEQLEQAHNTTTYPAKPSGICRRWCVVSSCPHHGRG